MGDFKPGKLVDISELSAADQALLAKAKETRGFAYCPYSNFPVGAAIRTKSGNVYGGCNVENGSYPASICAERNAVCQAIAVHDRSRIVAVSVVAHLEKSFCSPCGICRQVLSEFSDGDTMLFMSKPEGNEILCATMKEMLPLAFKFD